MNSKQRKKAGKATKVLVKAIEGGHFDEVLAALERPAFVERAAALLGNAWTWPPDGKGFYVSKAIAARRAILSVTKITINGAMLAPGSYSGRWSSRPWRSGPPIQQVPRPTKLADIKKFLRGSQVVSMSADDTFAFDVETYKTSPDEVRVVSPPAPQDPYAVVEDYRVLAQRAGEGGAFDYLYADSYMNGGESLAGVGEKIAEAIRELLGPPPYGQVRVRLPVGGHWLVCVVRP